MPRDAQPSTSTSSPLLVSGLEEVATKYQALLLDQFGVLHDGQKAVPGAPEAIKRLHQAGLKLLVISNSSRRSSGTLAKLSKLGFDASCFVGAVTSGELAWRFLTTRPDPWWQALGRRCVHIGWSTRGPISLEGYGLEVVEDVADADFVLAHGTEALQLADGSVRERSVEQLQAMLEQAARQRGSSLPMVVANPDLVTVDGDDLVTMPGTLARTFAQAGGKVVLMGKPDPVIYSACADILQLPPSTILAVGDSLEHDIAGAASAGVDSLFIASGIHKAELLQAGGQVDTAALAQLAAHHKAVPTYATQYFRW